MSRKFCKKEIMENRKIVKGISAEEWLNRKASRNNSVFEDFMDFSKIPLKEFNNKIMRNVDFTNSNISAAQWLSGRLVDCCILSQSMDFSNIALSNFRYRFFYNVDFSRTNITAEQLLESADFFCCKLPPNMDFSGISPEKFNKDLSGIDFSQTNISAKQFLNGRNFNFCILPKSMDFSALSCYDFHYKTTYYRKPISQCRSVHGIDFSQTNITAKQLFYFSNIGNCKLPSSIDFEELENISDTNKRVFLFENDYSITKNCLVFLLKRNELNDCIIPKNADFSKIPILLFKGKSLAGLDLSETNISFEQLKVVKEFPKKMPNVFDFNKLPIDFLKNKRLCGCDLTNTNITALHWLNAQSVVDSKLPTTVDFRDIPLSAFNKAFTGVDFSKTNITLEQYFQSNESYFDSYEILIFPDGCDFSKIPNEYFLRVNIYSTDLRNTNVKLVQLSSFLRIDESRTEKSSIKLPKLEFEDIVEAISLFYDKYSSHFKKMISSKNLNSFMKYFKNIVTKAFEKHHLIYEYEFEPPEDLNCAKDFLRLLLLTSK